MQFHSPPLLDTVVKWYLEDVMPLSVSCGILVCVAGLALASPTERQGKAQGPQRTPCTRLTFVSGQPACSQGSKSYSPGETWISSNLEYSCLPNGNPIATSCITDSKIRIMPGAQQAASGVLHRCVKREEDGDLVYITQICGAQVQCLSDGI